MINPHPFETVSLKRLSQAHPRFWERIEMSKVRAEIECINVTRARDAGLGDQLSTARNWANTVRG